MKRLLLILFLLSSIISFGQCPNNDNTDTDGDGVADCIDPCPVLPNSIAGNLSFESDFIGWTIPQNSANFNISNTSENVLHGNNTLQVTAPNSASFENYAIETEQFILEQDVAYNLKIPVKRLSPLDGDAIRWALVDSDGVYRHLNNYYNTTEDWNFITIENLVVNFDFYTNNTFRLRLEFGLSTVDMVVDKIEFYESIEGEDPAYQDLDSDGQPDCGTIDVSNHPDYNALVEIYSTTNGNNWNNSTNWLNTNAPLDTWYGISTTLINGEERVNQIDLSYNNLFGTIPPAITDIEYLSYLDLQVNQLEGIIPSNIGDLINLTFLRLNTNNLSGSIPPSIGDLNNLNYLILSVNNLTGGIPQEIGNLSSLNWLKIGGNPLGGTIPAQLGNLSNLGVLDLRANDLTGSIPPELGNLSNLYELFLFFNELSGTIPTELGNLTNLNNVSFNGNNLEGNIPTSFTNFTNLQYLNIADNNLGGTIPDFSSQPLDLLWVQHNRFTFADFENEFTTYQNSISDFQYTPQANRFIASSTISCENNICLPTANDVSLTFPMGGNSTTYQWYKDGSPINGETSSNLEILDFSNDDIGSYFCIGNNTIITDLTIYSDTLTISQPASQSTDYQFLVDFYNATNGDNWTNNTNWLDGTKPIGTWNGITETNGRVTAITLQQNNLSGSIPETFSNLTELKTFNIRLNNVNGSFPLSTFINQTQLEYVDINSNFMSGFIPPEIENLTNLWHLDIGWNGFSGAIPSEINNLNNIQNLYLHNNQLSGFIPISAGDLPNLQILYLADNNLAGTVPDLSGLPSLSYFAIFNNQFVFADLEPSYENLNTQLGFNYAYNPQKFIDIEKGISVNLNDTITLSSLAGLGSNLNVDWYKFDGTNYYFIESGESLDVTVNTEADYGDYIYYVTSPTIPNLGLQSNLITLGPSPSIHPDYNALLAVYNALDGDNWENSWDISTPITTWDIPAGYDELIFDDSTNRLAGIILYGTDKTGSIPNEIGDLDQLTYLSLQSENITGSIPNTIGNLLNLTDLWLFGNNLSGEVPSELWNLVSVKNLMIGNQADRLLTLNNGIPSNVANLQDLEWLNLSNIQMNSTFPAELFTLPNFVRLRVQNCGLTGTIPADFAMIDDIYADGNNFEGTIPDEILNVNGNTRLSITNNYYDFSDLEPLAQSNGYQNLNYSPQRTQDVEESIESGEGADITLTVNHSNLNRSTSEITAANNNYQWFKDNAIINGASGSSYTITNAQESDSGVYHCEITNPTLPELTIVRAPITLLIDESLGIENENLDNLSLYPNPTKNWINIKSQELNEAKLTIYDVRGSLILTKTINGSTNALNIESLQNGIYILELNNEGTSITKRFIKN